MTGPTIQKIHLCESEDLDHKRRALFGQPQVDRTHKKRYLSLTLVPIIIYKLELVEKSRNVFRSQVYTLYI